MSFLSNLFGKKVANHIPIEQMEPPKFYRIKPEVIEGKTVEGSGSLPEAVHAAISVMNIALKEHQYLLLSDKNRALFEELPTHNMVYDVR